MKRDNMVSDIDELDLLQVLQGMAKGALQQDKKQIPHVKHLWAAALTRPISSELQGKGDYSIAASHGVAVFKHRYDAVLDASTLIIMIEIPLLRLRAEMGKLRTAMDKASKEYDQEKELYAGLEEELSRFDVTLSSTVKLFTVQDERKARTLAEWLGGLLGLYNKVQVRQIEVKEDSTREVLKTALVHLNAMDL
jgi:hypothetical protein